MYPFKPCFSNRVRATLCVLVLLMSPVFISDVLAGNYFKGQIIYATYCQGCHGSDGKGALSGAPNFTRGLSLMKPDSSLFKTVINGQNAMPGFQGVLKNEDIYNVISYIRNFH